jgi:hypothetical protein
VLSLSVYPFAWSVLLNKVWGLAGCPLKGQLMLMNRSVRFDFCGSTVLVASSGDQVSCYTTVDVWCCPLKGQSRSLDLGIRVALILALNTSHVCRLKLNSI